MLTSVRGKLYTYLPTTEFQDYVYDLPKDLYDVLLSRMHHNEIGDFLSPKLKNLLPDPYVLPDMEKACQRALQALLTQEKIGILGDYDVDGATSAALLIRFLRHHNISYEIYIPDRLKEGYGPNHNAFQFFKAQGCTLIFVVDCGTAAASILDIYQDLDIIILDHHLPTEKTPQVLALVNPQIMATEDQAYLKHLSAGGITFLFLIGLNRLCTNKFDLMGLLDLVALSTVCDVMQLKGLNRAFVKQGLKILEKTDNLGIQALCKVAGLHSIKTTYDLGFVIGPRINAGGRLGQSYLGVNLLTTQDPKQAYIWAEVLNELNQQRQTIEEDMLNTAIQRVKRERLDQHPCLVLYDPHWHAGIVGIIAARLREIYNKPAFIAGAEEGGIAMGSARSVDGVNVGQLLQHAFEAGLLIAGGGHAKAGGFKIATPQIDKNTIDALYQFLNHQLLTMPPQSTPDTIHIRRTLSGMDKILADAIEQLHPFGPGQEEPLIAIDHVYIKTPTLLKDQHVKCLLIDGMGCTLPAIAFKALRYGLKEYLYHDGASYTCIGYLKNSPYGVQFQICDIMTQSHKQVMGFYEEIHR